MKLEQQVCSLELAKRLKELGVKQESLFGYTDYGSLVSYILTDYVPEPRYYAAFTVAELGEMMPLVWMQTKSIGRYRILWWKESPEKIYSETHRLLKCDCEILNESEANARAEMIIYLLENKLITK